MTLKILVYTPRITTECNIKRTCHDKSYSMCYMITEHRLDLGVQSSKSSPFDSKKQTKLIVHVYVCIGSKLMGLKRKRKRMSPVVDDISVSPCFFRRRTTKSR